jgi:hypothetical protein
MEQMQDEVNDFVSWVRVELGRAAQDGWQERLQQALVRLPPTPLARAAGVVVPEPASTPIAAAVDRGESGL